MKLTSGIYCFTNKINKKKYIGQSFNIKDRINQHKYRANCINDSGYNMPLHHAIRKYGWDNFKITIIERCQLDELDNREKYWIKKLNTLSPNGYNILIGGQSNRKNLDNNDHICPYCLKPKCKTAQMCKGCWKKHQRKNDKINFKAVLVDILDTNFEQASKKNGYNSSNTLRKVLKRNNYPIYRNDIYTWYEKEFGKKYIAVIKKEQREKERRINRKKQQPKKIASFDTKGNLVKTYPSASEAARDLGLKSNGHIVDCANGKLKTYKGFVWKYI